jgi:hypothetical protein
VIGSRRASEANTRAIQAYSPWPGWPWPFTGGFLVDQLNWRWVFYVVVALPATAMELRLPPQHRQHPIDYLGAALLAGAMTCLLLMLVSGGTFSAWSSPMIVGLTLAAVVLAAAYVVQERRAPEPVLPLPLLGNPVLAVSGATLFFSTCAFFGAILSLPLFIQLVRLNTARNSGVLLLPMMLAIALSAAVSGRLITQTGRYEVFPVVGLTTMAVTLPLFAGMDRSTPPVATGLLMAVFGLGFGMVGKAVQNGWILGTWAPRRAQPISAARWAAR